MPRSFLLLKEYFWLFVLRYLSIRPVGPQKERKEGGIRSKMELARLVTGPSF
jgi:hypothetical protein